MQTSLGYTVTTITSATTLDNTHNVVLCNTGPYTVTLPAAATNTGKVYYVKNIDADGDFIIIDGNVSETIEGNSNFYLKAYGHTARIISDGTGWSVINELGEKNTEHCGEYFEFKWNPVTNPETGKTWMDRNLGAKRVATTTTDEEAFGDLYQWGRSSDGHQCRNSATTTTLSTLDSAAGHDDFIITSTPPFNWLNTPNDNIWQSTAGATNPCPGGYRIPTEAEWSAEFGTWSSSDDAGALNSILKLPMAGFRQGSSAIIFAGEGDYWASDVSAGSARSLLFSTASVSMINAVGRAEGHSVRCIKNQ